MSEFNIGDKVVRKKDEMSSLWTDFCLASGVSPRQVFTVSSTTDTKNGGVVKLVEVTDGWDLFRFECVLSPDFSLDDYL